MCTKEKKRAGKFVIFAFLTWDSYGSLKAEIVLHNSFGCNARLTSHKLGMPSHTNGSQVAKQLLIEEKGSKKLGEAKANEEVMQSGREPLDLVPA